MNSDGAFSDGGDISELSDLYRAIDELKEVKTERDALKARVTELEAYLAGWVKISERNPPVPGVYKVMVTRPIHGGSFVSHIRWDGQLWESLWESLNVGPIDYQIVAWYDNGLEITAWRFDHASMSLL